MSLSANTLFHFTSNIDYLIGILVNGFLPRYSLEDFTFAYPESRNPGIKHPFKIGVPMTCFCDIRLTQTKNHSATYGKFVIGMQKEWGIKNRITPVTYFHPYSKILMS
ncbi:abortive infection system antitoxin AbiGi family protein [Adhaeribacter pallidiroseus]|uniref:abortive infection system antitoxin AbiGi family protein n=1 Tax=Adhaeribacter pallidiroseus TaxID=2072847 RepID=UPI000E1BE10A|nr:abortive infection system antitoxin AbiGi family protein [Adhaeribacter pallidiroseus]